MVSYYNLTNVTSANNWGEMAVESAKLAGGDIAGVVIVVLIVVVAFVSLKRSYDSQIALLSSGFLGLMVAGILAFTQLQLLAQRYFWMIAIIFALAYIIVNRFGKTE